MPADVKALRREDLALGDQPQLGVGEGMEGQPGHPQELRAQAALDLEAQRALGAGHLAVPLDPQLPVDAAQVPRAMLDPSRDPHTLKIQAGVSGHDGGIDLKH